MSENKSNILHDISMEELKIKYKRKVTINYLCIGHIVGLAIFAYIYYKSSYCGIWLIIGVINSIVALIHLTITRMKINKILKAILCHNLACFK